MVTFGGEPLARANCPVSDETEILRPVWRRLFPSLENFLRRTFPLFEPSLEKVKIVAALGLPLGFSQGARILQDVSNAILLGRYQNSEALAAVAASGIWTSITDIVLLSGIGQLSTLCSQAHGAGNLRLLGTWLQLFLVFSTICSIPVLGLRLYTGPILEALKVQKSIAEPAGVYTIWSSFAILFDVWYYSIKEYYAAQRIVRPAAVLDFCFIFVNLAVASTFLYGFGWGIRGVGLATSLSRLVRTLVFVFYCSYKGYHRRTWGGWSWPEIWVRHRWRTMMALTLPAAVSGLAEELQFQVNNLMAAQIGKAETAALSLTMQMVLLCFLFAMSMGEAIGIYMARELGANRPTQAHFVSKVGLGFVWVGSAFFALVFAFAVPLFARVATADSEVREQMNLIAWPIATSIFFLGGFMVLVNILMKQGRVVVVGLAIPLMCWGAGFPVSFLLSRHWGLLGIVLGLGFGYILATALLFVCYLRSNWPDLALKAVASAESTHDGLTLPTAASTCEN